MLRMPRFLLNRFSVNSASIALALGVSFQSIGTLQAQYAGSVEPPEALKAGFDSITPEQSKEWLSILAGPTFEGRGTGQVGYAKAAHWVSGKLAEFGLQPMGDGNSYFQMLPMTSSSIDNSQSKLTGPNGLVIPTESMIGFDRFPADPEISGKLIFAKLSGEAPKLDDTAFQDKIVIFMADEKATPRQQMIIGRRGAKASFVVVEGNPKSTSQLNRPGSRRGRASGSISKVAAKQLLKSAGLGEDWFDSAVTDTTVADTQSEVTIGVRLREEPTVVPNVLAWQEGSDPALRDEYVVIGSHLDHLGMQNGVMFPGADDNGSGSTAVLNIAKAIATNPVKPKRSVLFIWFAAEEMGLVGSAHYVDHPLLPLDKMVCMLNIDMVGRNEEKGNETAAENERVLHLVGSQKGNLDLHQVILDANQNVKLEFEFDEENVFGRSDQFNFFKKGTSVAFLFGGFHPDYHQPSDNVSKINFNKIASAAKLFYVTIHKAAEHGPFPVPTAK